MFGAESAPWDLEQKYTLQTIEVMNLIRHSLLHLVSSSYARLINTIKLHWSVLNNNTVKPVYSGHPGDRGDC